MRLYVGLTDRDWYRYLLQHQELEEVNFWRPRSQSEFHALSEGDPFLFKLHYPERAICGVGWFEGFTKLPVHFAWKFFKEGNGAPTYEEFLERLRPLRHGEPVLESEELGCIMLRSLTMFPRDDWIAEPADWERNIVQGKGYDTERGVGRELWEQVLERLPGAPLPAGEHREEAPVQFTEGWSRQRRGQGAFAALVATAYQQRCAFTRERVLPTLEACHIRPAAKGGSHAVSNGLLLRSDVHQLFDLGYLGLHPRTLQIQASPRLQLEFQNGAEYRALQGQIPILPAAAGDRPSPAQLEWHMEEVWRR